MFILTIWNVAKLRKKTNSRLGKALRQSMIGYMFLFIASWFACGIGGPPGNMLSADASVHNQFGALGAASMAMFLSVPGWYFIFLSYGSMMRSLLMEAEENKVRMSKTQKSG